MATRRITQLVLLLLLFSTSALASDGTRHDRRSAPAAAEAPLAEEPFWRRWGHGSGVMAADASEARQQVARGLVMEQERIQQKKLLRRRQPTEVVGADRPEITPAPPMPECLLQGADLELLKRQDDGQIQALSGQIRSISDVANSFSRASQQVSQSSQQLSQSVQQLSQSSSRFASSVASLQQVTQQLQQSAQQAQESAKQAGDAARQASESASRAVSSAQSSASSAVANNFAAATQNAAESMSSLLQAASASAAGIMQAASSQVQAAKADATIARADAASQVQQAQGAAVSVTQAALAVVGTFIGSSLLTILAFVLILKLRAKRQRRRTLATAQISYPRSTPSDGELGDAAYDSQTSFARFGAEKGVVLANPPPVMAGANRASLGSVQDLPGGFASTRAPVLGSPPAAARRGHGGGGGSAGAASFTLFPKTTSPGARGASPTGGAAGRESPARPYSGAVAAPSLQQWLRAGTVSPFGTLKRDSLQGGAAAGKAVGGGGGWPFDKRDQAGGARVMQPGRGLPLRDS